MPNVHAVKLLVRSNKQIQMLQSGWTAKILQWNKTGYMRVTQPSDFSRGFDSAQLAAYMQCTVEPLGVCDN